MKGQLDWTLPGWEEDTIHLATEKTGGLKGVPKRAMRRGPFAVHESLGGEARALTLTHVPTGRKVHASESFERLTKAAERILEETGEDPWLEIQPANIPEDARVVAMRALGVTP